MEQTRLLLISAREDYSLALNVLFLLATRSIPSNIEDIMYGYMVAKDWVNWIKNPNSSDDVDNFMPDKKAEDYQSMVDVLEGYADNLEDHLKAYQDYIEDLFRNLNTNLVQLWNGAHRHLNIREDTRLFFRSLRYTAQVFEKRFHATFLTKILDDKQVPPMSELNAKTNT